MAREEGSCAGLCLVIVIVFIIVATVTAILKTRGGGNDDPSFLEKYANSNMTYTFVLLNHTSPTSYTVLFDSPPYLVQVVENRGVYSSQHYPRSFLVSLLNEYTNRTILNGTVQTIPDYYLFHLPELSLYVEMYVKNDFVSTTVYA